MKKTKIITLAVIAIGVASVVAVAKEYDRQDKAEWVQICEEAERRADEGQKRLERQQDSIRELQKRAGQEEEPIEPLYLGRIPED